MKVVKIKVVAKGLTYPIEKSFVEYRHPVKEYCMLFLR